MKILTINSGSSSLKFSIYRMKTGVEELVTKGELTEIGTGKGMFFVEDNNGNRMINKHKAIETHNEALNMLFEWIGKDPDEEDPFSDKNRWRRGILEDPDADSW